MFLLPASQQSCQSSSRKLKHKERKSLIKIIPGEHSLESFSETPSQVLSTTCQQQQQPTTGYTKSQCTRTKQSPLFTQPLHAKHSRREEAQRIHGIFKAKGKRKRKKWYEYDIDELVIYLAHTKSSLI